MGIHALPARRFGRLGLVALLGLTLALVTVSAGHANASSWHKVGATSAKKKKCKKKKHHSVSSAKKKKCKKKKHAAPPAPVPRGPIVRLDVTWSTDAEIDAHAWSNGQHDGWSEVLVSYETGIPGTTFETSSSRERITELNPNPSISPYTFGICYYPDPEHDAGPTDINVTTVFADGVSHTQVLHAQFDDAFTSDPEEGGPPAPLEDWCPQVL
jgi:hypothetical protein